MEVEQVRNCKKEAEEEIAKIICEFENKTGLSVEDINHVVDYVKSDSGFIKMYDVYLKVMI